MQATQSKPDQHSVIPPITPNRINRSFLNEKEENDFAFYFIVFLASLILTMLIIL